MASRKEATSVRDRAGPEDRFTHLAVTYLARQDRTESQLAEYLLRKGAPSAAIGRTIERFRTLGYLDDGRVARRWAEARVLRRPMGAARLRMELLAKGIAEGLVTETVAALYPQGHERVLAERVLATASVGRRLIPLSKLVRLLRSRGFEDDVIEAILERRMAREMDEPGDAEE